MPDGLNVQNDSGGAIVGTTTAQGGIGILYAGVSGDGPNLGVYGTAINGAGVHGNDAGGTGVLGTTSNGAGVYGAATGGTGVYATAADGTGVWGASETGVGVIATSDSAAAVSAYSRFFAGVAAVSDHSYAVLAVSNGGNAVAAVGDGHHPALYVVHGPQPAAPVAHFVGDVAIDGAIMSPMPKNAVVPLPDGSRRALYCVESPECWFEDFGRARLVRGRARVRLEHTFASVVRTGDYHVFLSPEGLSHGLYVHRRTREGFEVREQHRGTSSVGFSYRIVARRRDVEAPRFKRVTFPARRKISLPPRPKPPVIPKRLREHLAKLGARGETGSGSPSAGRRVHGRGSNKRASSPAV